MKKLFTLALILFFSTAYAAKKEGIIYDYEVDQVKDGDTVSFKAPFLPAPLKPVLSIRVLGVDTPEKGHRAQCDSEAKKGEEATKFTKDAVAKAKKIQFEIVDWDKFGGRVLGDVILDGERLSQLLIKNGLAREYWGDKKESWCK